MEHLNLFDTLGFVPKEGAVDVLMKKYQLHDGYCIEVDLTSQTINYGTLISYDSKTTQNFSSSESFVVLECVNRLLEKGYKPQNIVLEKTYPSGHGTSGRLDICVNREDGSPYLLIECKTFKGFDKEFTKTKKDGGQLFTYFQISGCKADILMLYASECKKNEVVYLNEIIKIEDEYRSGEVKDIYEKWNKLTKDNGIFDEWCTLYNFRSKALTKEQLKEIRSKDSSFIFNRFLEILRHNVVSDKGNAFNKIFTLFLCKVYDETSTLDGEELQFQWREGIDDHRTFQLRLTDLYGKGMHRFLERTVSDFDEAEFETKYKSLISANDELYREWKEQINKIRLEKNNEFAIKEVYDSQSFDENAKVVKEVVELIQGYRIRYNKRQQYLSDFFELLLTTGLKQEAGQFFTPVPIAQFIIKSLPLDGIVVDKLKSKDGEILPYMIDYAAGSGHFITEYMHEVQRIIDNCNPKDFIQGTEKEIKNWQEDHFRWATDYVYGVEKDYRLVKVGKVGCYLHGDGLANVILSDGLANFGNNKEYKGKLKKDAKNTSKDNQQFDVILSNPPYSVSSFRQTTRDYYTEKDFELYSSLTDNSSEIECLFVERTKQLLKEGGIAGVILPSSILSNSGIYAKTRELILQYFEIVAITEFGSNTFMATGTNTVVLFLRRRNNYDYINIRDAVNNSFKTLVDGAINGVATPIAKYVAHVWEGLTYDDYISLLQKRPNEKVETHEIFADYRKNVKAKDDTELLNKIIEIECEKLGYFVLVYPQQNVVLINSGEKDVEKRFLGYEFSKKRGNEGIHPIQRGKHIDECTQLFDTNICDNPDKASTYVRKAFYGDFSDEIAESLRNHVSRVRLVDMLTFDRVKFDKTISTAIKKKVRFETIWGTDGLVELKSIANIQKGTSITKNKTTDGNIPVIAGGQDIAYYNNVANRTGNIITISASGAYSGFVNYYAEPIFASDCNTVQSKNEVVISTKLIFVLLKYIQKELYELQRGQAQPHVYGEDIAKIKIPLPPLDIQSKIVAEIEALEKKGQEAKVQIERLKDSISSLMNDFDDMSKEKLGNISLFLKRGKSANYGNSNIQIIKSGQARGIKEFDFSHKYYVDDSFLLDERKLEKGDILINSTGVGTAGRVTLFDLDGIFCCDSHITIFRPDRAKVLPDFALQSLIKIGFKNIEAMALGQSGQIELSLQTIQNIKIPLPSIIEQQKIVDEIEIIEQQIAEAQTVIDNISELKDEVLMKYL